MTTYDNGSAMRLTGLPTPPLWVCILLGIVMIIAGLLVLGDLALFTVISTIFIGWMAIFAGGFEIIHAFWTKGWGGFLWQLLLGALYLAFGIVLVTQPLTSALILTLVLGLLLLISGCIRILVGISHWQQFGWIILMSGLFGVVAGLIILTGFPATGTWVIGLLLGIDLLSHGIGWLTLAWLPAVRTG
ncbi:HdeD family acid-resistance protein [Bradyrhizobium neotropicale]|uniref:HdeD family acid-resistance protein n=1 Tax=Bradyrhizobium neotropicale TaxID=1497615 RepID=UPI001AD70F4A|nr:HdeD family acid-resistance protein [Bradyrhizobium neotropicale]MBO4222198.1 HdeD family acid-resistance protein [Bradyrhizobium neotropicale]